MADPQPGLFAQGVIHHFHTEFTVKEGVDGGALRDAITNARRAATWLGSPNVTWGFSPKLWDALAPATRPESIEPFTEIKGVTGLVAPCTQFDVWVWCSSALEGSVTKNAALIVDALAPAFDLAAELPGYTTFDSRDPTGFIDGTENPLADEAYDVAVFPDDAVGAGGSSVLVQKWVHRLDAFEALPINEQEDVIGRTKDASIQLPDSQMPTTSHVSRNTVVDTQGEERHIYRRNTPYNTGDEIGTQFIGVSNDPELTILMLERMFGATSDGLIDALATFSDAVTGSMYFVPSMQELTTQFGPLKVEDEDGVPADPNVPPSDGNLRIGSLK